MRLWSLLRRSALACSGIVVFSLRVDEDDDVIGSGRQNADTALFGQPANGRGKVQDTQKAAAAATAAAASQETIDRLSAAEDRALSTAAGTEKAEREALKKGDQSAVAAAQVAQLKALQQARSLDAAQKKAGLEAAAADQRAEETQKDRLVSKDAAARGKQRRIRALEKVTAAEAAHQEADRELVQLHKEFSLLQRKAAEEADDRQRAQEGDDLGAEDKARSLAERSLLQAQAAHAAELKAREIAAAAQREEEEAIKSGMHALPEIGPKSQRDSAKTHLLNAARSLAHQATTGADQARDMLEDRRGQMQHLPMAEAEFTPRSDHGGRPESGGKSGRYLNHQTRVTLHQEEHSDIPWIYRKVQDILQSVKEEEKEDRAYAEGQSPRSEEDAAHTAVPVSVRFSDPSELPQDHHVAHDKNAPPPLGSHQGAGSQKLPSKGTQVVIPEKVEPPSVETQQTAAKKAWLKELQAGKKAAREAMTTVLDDIRKDPVERRPLGKAVAELKAASQQASNPKAEGGLEVDASAAMSQAETDSSSADAAYASAQKAVFSVRDLQNSGTSAARVKALEERLQRQRAQAMKDLLDRAMDEKSDDTSRALGRARGEQRKATVLADDVYAGEQVLKVDRASIFLVGDEISVGGEMTLVKHVDSATNQVVTLSLNEDHSKHSEVRLAHRTVDDDQEVVAKAFSSGEDTMEKAQAVAKLQDAKEKRSVAEKELKTAEDYVQTLKKRLGDTREQPGSSELTKAAKAGEQRLTMSSTHGFFAGDEVVVGREINHLTAVTADGNIDLATGLQAEHQAGVQVRVVRPAAVGHAAVSAPDGVEHTAPRPTLPSHSTAQIHPSHAEAHLPKCHEGLSAWTSQWSEEKKKYCCKTAGVGCEHDVQKKPASQSWLSYYAGLLKATFQEAERRFVHNPFTTDLASGAAADGMPGLYQM
eukprot:TRINITY_DN13645_c0_g1_i1.p1 TRINITY_DN13645_c0_g1~~TRINITY_DN13645_c0_g1_i1.p1  ORF type:complete len:933 (-),score=221.19 TRINITY_DN13645_c0_g1_i1:7-2805(-)